jgi:hypothetical protein
MARPTESDGSADDTRRDHPEKAFGFKVKARKLDL